MPKLYFRYGAMNSSKSANAIMVAHTYASQGKSAIVIKSSLDTRDTFGNLVSRAGLTHKVDLIVQPNQKINVKELKHTDCIIVDEVQFLDPQHIDELRAICEHTPVICYGLRTDYKTKLFPASARLMELADVIEEIPTTCQLCHKRAIINAKIINGEIMREGSDEFQVGGNELYHPMCWLCWKKK